MFLNSIYTRIRLLISRYINSRKFGLFFFSSRFFKIPRKIKLSNRIIDLNLPSEKNMNVIFTEIFLDDTYKLKWIKNFSKKNGIQINSILDIGGNCGLTSMLSRSYFPSSIIHCYEPNTEIEKFLESNAKIANFKYFLEAVGAKSSMVKLNIDRNQSVLSSISPDEVGSTKQVSFKEALQRFGNIDVDIVKMDCEGSEWEILDNLDLWNNIKFITMEYHLGKGNYDHNRITKALAKIGFKIIPEIESSNDCNYGIAVAYNKNIQI